MRCTWNWSISFPYIRRLRQRIGKRRWRLSLEVANGTTENAHDVVSHVLKHHICIELFCWLVQVFIWVELLPILFMTSTQSLRSNGVNDYPTQRLFKGMKVKFRGIRFGAEIDNSTPVFHRILDFTRGCISMQPFLFIMRAYDRKYL